MLVVPAAQAVQLVPDPKYPGAHIHDVSLMEPVVDVVRPEPHDVQGVLIANALNLPTEHAVQVVPSPLYPGAHKFVRQSDIDVAPVAAVANPFRHGMHKFSELDPVVGPYLPIGHPVHTDSPAIAANVPGGQEIQSVIPWTVPYFPNTQGWQEAAVGAAIVVEYFPGTHIKQYVGSLCPEPYCPGGQFVHRSGASVPVLYCPAGQL